MIRFILNKIQGYSLLLLIQLELESLCFKLGSFIPTTMGIFIRAALAKLFFGQCRGCCWIQPNVTLVHSGRLRVGKCFGVNSYSYINAIGGIEIGDYVLLGNGVTLSSGQHGIDGQMPEIFNRPTIPQKIIIEDDVWIGAGAVIMPGIRLARGSVIGANAVVTKDTQPYGVYVGVPARFLRQR